MYNRNNTGTSLLKSVLMAYGILVLHVVLIGMLGILVLFFGGLVNHMFWIFIALMALLVFSGYYFFRRLKAIGRGIGSTLESGPFRNRPVEVSFLGGLASFRLGRPEIDLLEQSQTHDPRRQLEDPTAAGVREISQLVKLLEEGHITQEEFLALKQGVFRA